MTITFDAVDNEVTFVLDSDATGPSAAFTAGQTTEKGECSLGCHDNFYAYTGRKVESALDVDITDFKGADDSDLKQTDETPCGIVCHDHCSVLAYPCCMYCTAVC